MGFPGSGNAEQGLRLHACVEARCELLYGPRLVARWLIFAVYPESVPRRILHTETSWSFLGREASRFWNIRPDYTANAGFFSALSVPAPRRAAANPSGNSPRERLTRVSVPKIPPLRTLVLSGVVHIPHMNYFPASARMTLAHGLSQATPGYVVGSCRRVPGRFLAPRALGPRTCGSL